MLRRFLPTAAQGERFAAWIARADESARGLTDGRAVISDANGAAPFHCPYCAEEDLRPLEDRTAQWLCGSCRRAFALRFIGMEVSGDARHRSSRHRAPGSAPARKRDTAVGRARRRRWRCGAGRELEDASALEILRWAADELRRPAGGDLVDGRRRGGAPGRRG